MQPRPVDQLIEWAARILQTADVPPDDALITSRLLVRSDLRGYGTHGLARLTSYMERLRQGEFNARPDMRFHQDGAAWRVEADGALGQVAAQRVLDAALPYLATAPMLWVSLEETGHLGALGLFVLEAAEAGYICFMGQRTPPLLGLPGFQQPGIGHNPFAFGCPTADGLAPLVFDMACSVAARGHILLAAREGKAVPSDWALDTTGKPTTDPEAAAAGMLQPAGGYKGMGLAMMIECLAAGLSATAASNAKPVMKIPANGAVPRQSAFLFFLNPARVGDDQSYSAYMTHWITHYKQSGTDKARIPGERGDMLERERRENGIAYPAAIDAELRRLGDQSGIPLA
jgi:LDH2 family malate/lactate/ureidoglycolate dehydrogenase